MATPDEKLRALCLEAARQIARECQEEESGLRACGAPVVQLLGRQAARIVSLAETRKEQSEADQTAIARRLADLVEIAHARFYAWAPGDVPVCWRQLYTDASILQCAALWLALEPTGRDAAATAAAATVPWDRLVRPLDMALVLAGGAGPAGRGRAWLQAALDGLQNVWEERAPRGHEPGEAQTDREPPDWSAAWTFPVVVPSVHVPSVRHPVPRRGALGLTGFQAYLDRGRRRRRSAAAAGGEGPQPVVLTGLTDDWPARQSAGRPWAAPAYLRWRTLGGRRLVPVEIGRSYVDAGWTQAVVPFARVLEALEAEPAAAPAADTVYLAQHALFVQIPHLRDDIRIPDACYTDPGDMDPDTDTDMDTDADAQEPLVHAWLGPPGTITPLHTDPHHNLLAQVVGRKYVRLYAPAQTAALRPRGREGGVDMGNTSTLDVGVLEGWDARGGDGSTESDTGADADEADAAAFRQAPFVDCILEPGDTLYIPRGWWHYVRGLSVSFSVSFWWD